MVFEPAKILSSQSYVLTCTMIDNPNYNLVFTLRFADSPSLIFKPTNETVTEGDLAMFICDATGNPTPKITWIKDGETVDEGNTLNFEALRNQSGKYWCVAENGLNKTVNTSAYLDVQCEYDMVLIVNFDGSAMNGIAIISFLATF